MLNRLRDRFRKEKQDAGSLLDLHRSLEKERKALHRESSEVISGLRLRSPDAGEKLEQLDQLTTQERALARKQREVWQDIAHSLEQARQWEREGNLSLAIPVYEALVCDQFPGTMPYDRLRILYTRQKQFEDAIRVCEAYLALPDRPVGQNKPHFVHHRDKLRGRVAREKG